MQAIAEALIHILGYVLAEIFAYWTGRLIAPILLPHLGIEPFRRQRSKPGGWKWRGLTYRRGSRRYLYTESIQLIGAIVWLLVIASAFIIYWSNRA